MISNTVCDGWRKISYYGWEGLGHGGEFRRHYGASVLTNALYGPGFLRATPSSVPDWDSYALHTGADSILKSSTGAQTSVRPQYTPPRRIPTQLRLTIPPPETCAHTTDQLPSYIHQRRRVLKKENCAAPAAMHHLWARTPPQDEHNKPCIDS